MTLLPQEKLAGLCPVYASNASSRDQRDHKGAKRAMLPDNPNLLGGISL